MYSNPLDRQQWQKKAFVRLPPDKFRSDDDPCPAGWTLPSVVRDIDTIVETFSPDPDSRPHLTTPLQDWGYHP